MPAARIVKAIFLTVVFTTVLTGGMYGRRASPVYAAAVETHDIRVDGQTRTYSVYVPSSYHGQQPVPVVVMLHGAGGTGEGVIPETGWDRQAEQAGFLAVFPDALRINQEAAPSLLTNPQMWNDGSKRGENLLPKADDVKFLALMLEHLAQQYAIDPKAIFATGFSSGASMLFKAANELPGRFAAIAPVAGHYWPPAVPGDGKAVPTLFIAGTADPLNPFDGGTVNLPWGSFAQPPVMKTVREWTKRNGLSQELKAAAGRTGVAVLQAVRGNREWQRVYIVEGLGHMWPGGEAIFPESFIGKDPGTLAATQVIWDYFAQVCAWR